MRTSLKLRAVFLTLSVLMRRRTLHVGYYTDVKNSPALRQGLLDKKFDAALVNAQLVLILRASFSCSDVSTLIVLWCCQIAGPFQVHAAAARALQCDASGRLTTRSLHAELVFNMSGSRNVSSPSSGSE